MTRFSKFTDEELDIMEEAFCNERLKYLVDEVRREKRYRESRESRQTQKNCRNCGYPYKLAGKCYSCDDYSQWIPIEADKEGEE